MTVSNLLPVGETTQIQIGNVIIRLATKRRGEKDRKNKQTDK